jgi:hypothetical protein
MPDDRIRPDDGQPMTRRPTRSANDDDFDERPRPRRLERVDEEETGDMTGGIIPYKNGLALASYYCGVFSLIPILGMVLGPIALVLGFLGFRYAGRHRKAGGTAHAIVGIILGGLVLLGHVALFGLVLAGML